MGGFKKQKNIEFSKLESYKAKNELPKEMKKNQIYVDSKNNSILLPINGTHIPFHIHTLKSVVKNDEGKCASLRFNFILPGTISNVSFPKFNETTIYVKEMVFRSLQIARITDL
jgi:nucleosome binding factor SPN SPT16 subunit